MADANGDAFANTDDADDTATAPAADKPNGTDTDCDPNADSPPCPTRLMLLELTVDIDVAAADIAADDDVEDSDEYIDNGTVRITSAFIMASKWI